VPPSETVWWVNELLVVTDHYRESRREMTRITAESNRSVQERVKRWWEARGAGQKNSFRNAPNRAVEP
jgi:hypothetical protein